MQKALGDDPGATERIKFKRDWCKERYISISHNCFLCEHVDNDSFGSPNCSQCLVLWPDDFCCYDRNCGSRDEYYLNSCYLNAPISDILNLPTREFVGDRRTRIRMRECDVEELKKRIEEGE